jgi:hypothetical protein
LGVVVVRAKDGNPDRRAARPAGGRNRLRPVRGHRRRPVNGPKLFAGTSQASASNEGHRALDLVVEARPHAGHQTGQGQTRVPVATTATANRRRLHCRSRRPISVATPLLERRVVSLRLCGGPPGGSPT